MHFWHSRRHVYAAWPPNPVCWNFSMTSGMSFGSLNFGPQSGIRGTSLPKPFAAPRVHHWFGPATMWLPVWPGHSIPTTQFLWELVMRVGPRLWSPAHPPDCPLYWNCLNNPLHHSYLSPSHPLPASGPRCPGWGMHFLSTQRRLSSAVVGDVAPTAPLSWRQIAFFWGFQYAFASPP